jgi:hypothetical protein
MNMAVVREMRKVEMVAPYTCRKRKLCTGLFHLRENSSQDVEFHLETIKYLEATRRGELTKEIVSN